MPTLLEQLSQEAARGLHFYYKGAENVDRPGQPHRVGDRLKFTVYARNTSQVLLKNLAINISPTPATNFAIVGVQKDQLPPNQEISLSEILADVVANPNDIPFFGADKIAQIDATGVVDLSFVQFTDTGILADLILEA